MQASKSSYRLGKHWNFISWKYFKIFWYICSGQYTHKRHEEDVFLNFPLRAKNWHLLRLLIALFCNVCLLWQGQTIEMQSECHVLVHEKCLSFQSKIFFRSVICQEKNCSFEINFERDGRYQVQLKLAEISLISKRMFDHIKVSASKLKDIVPKTKIDTRASWAKLKFLRSTFYIEVGHSRRH